MRIASSLMSALLGAGLIVGPAWATADDPRGIWIDDKGRGGVEIKDCGANLCGHVVWAKDEADNGKGCGKQIIGDVEPQGRGLWDNGWIYDPDSGKRYDVELKLLDEKRLRVKGYAGAKFFSRSMIWTRAPDDIKRCDASAVKTPGNSASADPVEGAKATTSTEPSKSATVTAPAVPSAGQQPDAKSRAGAEQPKPDATTATRKPDAPRVAAAEEPDDPDRPRGGAPHERLRDLKFGNGYGVTPTGNGHCRLRVPYFSMTFDCQND